ncbi:MAG: ankyrin repeat domain-containing protein [Pseudomonadota bacterium]|nr:ankyrin repeat domain-containing protein [Pseudomonadota bacterium]
MVRKKSQAPTHAEFLLNLAGNGECFDNQDEINCDLNQLNSDGENIIHIISKQNKVAILKKLANRDINFEQKNNEKKTPLDLAKEYNHQEIVKLLTAIIGKKFKHRKFIIRCTVFSLLYIGLSSYLILYNLEKFNLNFTMILAALIVAAAILVIHLHQEYSDSKTISTEIGVEDNIELESPNKIKNVKSIKNSPKRYSPNIWEIESENLLMTAIHSEEVEHVVNILNNLKENNINLLDVNSFGRNALHFAVERLSPEIVKEILAKEQINIDSLDDHQHSPLHTLAYYYDHRKSANNKNMNKDISTIADLLIKEGSNVNLANNQFSITPLHTAASKNNIEVVSSLLRGNADVNLKDASGNTPLHYICCSKQIESDDYTEVLKKLLDAGANPYHENDKGESSIALSRKNNLFYLTNIMLNYNKNVTSVSRIFPTIE